MAGIRSSRQGSSEEPVEPEIFDPTFTDFVRRIVSVPHSEIKAKLDAEREAKRISKTSPSRVPAVPSKVH
jgi:hypothetical protein